MHYVYLLRSKANPREIYIGTTSHLRKRLVKHNEAKSPHPANSYPWQLVPPHPPNLTPEPPQPPPNTQSSKPPGN